jgi:hypothetical protein
MQSEECIVLAHLLCACAILHFAFFILHSDQAALVLPRQDYLSGECKMQSAECPEL